LPVDNQKHYRYVAKGAPFSSGLISDDKKGMSMNPRQRIILAVGLAVLAIMCLFPPWFGDGYALIFLTSSYARLDFTRLGVQVVAVVAATGTALLLVRAR
jgi:hypothetical protein